ncbi:PGL/p-HBAD biosynthesis glycosyltransferase [Bacteroidales bacterium Barb6]|nr:PGL/p-HBAD biosynthesis glycosyltransferase [Bacteroidales bacterium Barb6]
MTSLFPATPLITVVTVAYNSIGTLEKTIQSVITQDYGNTEYILIDGGSTDGSIDMIKKYASRLSAWISEKDNGIYHAMNKGIRMASGKWICFLNSGDVFADTSILNKVIQATTRLSGSPQIVYGNILVRNPDGTLTERIAKEPCNIHQMYFCHQSAFVKTSLMKNYLFDEHYKFSADLKFFKQCYYNRQAFIHLNLPVVIYDTNGISNTRREDGLRDNIAVVKSNRPRIKEIPVSSPSVFRNLLAKIN